MDVEGGGGDLVVMVIMMMLLLLLLLGQIGLGEDVLDLSITQLIKDALSDTRAELCRLRR